MKTMTERFLRWILTGVCLAGFAAPLGGWAATVGVTVGPSGAHTFSPASVNISVNDTVLWTWASSPHNVTSTNSAWAASPTQGSGTTFANTFSTPGRYFYYCTIHGTATSGMTGAVMVAVANLPPTVSVTNPLAGAVFAAPAIVTIRASASDSDGTVTNVHFLIGTTNLGNVTAPPYALATSGLAAGTYTLSAVASDNLGATDTNSVAISVVNPTNVLLSAQAVLAPAKFRFTFSASSGLNYVVERSTNLLSGWSPLVTNTASSGSINYTDQNANLSPGFYRVGRMPNP